MERERSVSRREWRWVALVTLALLLASWLPYAVGWAAAPPGAHFAGLVYNPLDGQSYIAKMRLGFDGSWLFRLTYTHQVQPGAPIYLFYLFLGHLSRWTHLPLLAIYHAARTAGGLALLVGLYRLAAHLADGVRQRRLLFLVAATGAGLGWLAVLLGRQLPDLWVFEAFTFSAILTNAHFPAALALMVWCAGWGLRAQDSPRAGLALVAGALVLGVVQPFGLVALLGGLVGALAARWGGSRRGDPPWSPGPWSPLRGGVWVALTALLALPYPLYTLGVLRADPLFAAWSAQNVTPSPSLGEWLLGFGVLGPLAAVGVVHAVRRGRAVDGLLLGWLAATVVGLALPLDLARRLSLGLGIAVGLLAGLGWIGLWAMVRRRATTAGATTEGATTEGATTEGRPYESDGTGNPRARPGQPRGDHGGSPLLVALAALTPLFLLVVGTGAALGGHPLLYLSDGEWAALGWLRDHAPHDAVVLCAPETGLFVPAWGGQRVVYGHPFETVEAAVMRAEVERFWAGERDGGWLDTVGVDYILYGPRERALGGPPPGALVFQAGDTAVYRWENGP